mgnify:CR=1 FL=1
MSANRNEKPMRNRTLVYALFCVLMTTVACGEATIYDETGGAVSSTISTTSGQTLGGKSDSPIQQSEPKRAFDAETCSYDPADPYEPRARFQVGPFQGECLDTEIRRPVQILSVEGEQFTTLELANVFHDGGYWIAKIPAHSVNEVYFQLEYFPAVVPAGHTQIRIEFIEPVELTGQSQWNLGRKQSIYNLVLSAEAVPRIGDKYDLVKGMKDHFGLALRVTSLGARYDSMILEKNHHVEQWRLQLTEREKKDLLLFYAYESEALGLETTYHTLFRNCTTELIRNLDGVVHYTLGEKIKKFLTKGTEFYPNIIRAALIARGLLPLNQSTDWYPLEEDPTFPW